MKSESLAFTPSTDPRLVLDHLQSILDNIKKAFKSAIPDASRFFAAEGEQVERTLFAGMVRWYVKKSLRQLGIDASLEYELDDVANIGLIINCQGFQVRILKARDSRVPVSNSSLREEFYQHNLTFESPALLVEQETVVLNLVVLWETDYISAFALSVACPKREITGNSEGRKTVECFWQVPITDSVIALRTELALEPLRVVDADLEEVTLLEEQSEHDAASQKDDAESVRAMAASAIHNVKKDRNKS
jgi:hypothetical protein